MIYSEEKTREAFSSLEELLKGKEEEELINLQKRIYEELLYYHIEGKPKKNTFNEITKLIESGVRDKKNNASLCFIEGRIKSTVELYMNLTLPRYFLKHLLNGIEEDKLNELDIKIRNKILNADHPNILTEITNNIYYTAQGSTLPELRHLGQQPCKVVAKYYIQFSRKWPLSMNLITCAVYLSYFPLWLTYLISNIMVVGNYNCVIIDKLRYLKDNLPSFEVYVLFISAAIIYLIAYNLFMKMLLDHGGIIAVFVREQTAAIFLLPTIFYIVSFIRVVIGFNYIREGSLIITFVRGAVFVIYLTFLWIYLISPWRRQDV